MYDDLFGDLPQAKGAQHNSSKPTNNNNNDDEEKKQNNTSNTNDNSKAVGTSSKQDENENQQWKESSEISNKQNTQPKSIVQSLGNAGTTVSFVPLALKRRKRPMPGNSSASTTKSKKRQGSFSLGQHIVQSDELVDGVNSKYSKDISQKSSALSDNAIHVIQTDTDVSENSENNNLVRSQLSTIVSETGTTITTHKKGESVQQIVLNPHQILDDNAKSTTTGNVDNNNNKGTKNDQTIQLINDDENTYVESEELQKLHISIHPYDMYNPMEPNDYLTYKQNKENENLRKDLERQAMKTLELQQQLRDHIEEERKKVLDSGDVDKIIESRIEDGVAAGGGVGRDRGRGRGRGLTNLPAWLIKKQQEQKESSSSQHVNQIEGQFDDANNATHSNKRQGYKVVLSDMVEPDDVDDELKDEVKDECESKCGKVIDVRVDVSPAAVGGEVKVYVTFQNESDAKAASLIFHGRMFGQRQIKAYLL